MAGIAVDVRSAGTKTVGATSLTMTHTVSAGLTNGILVVEPTTGAPSAVAVNTVSWDTAGVNEVCTFRAQHPDSNCRAELWDRKVPTAGASKTITVTPASSCEITVCASSYQGVNQTTPWRGSTWPTAGLQPSGGVPQPSVAVTTVANDMVVACVFSNENSSDDVFTATGTTTLIGSQNVGAAKHSGGAGDCPAVGTTTTVSFAGVADTNDWGIVAGALQWDGTFGSGGGGITGTGAVTLAPTLAGTGQRGNIGTGSSAVALTLTGTGKSNTSGTGSAAVAGKLSLAGTGKSNTTGTGSVAVAGNVSLAGTGIRGNIGTGAVAVKQSITLSGSAPSSSVSGSGGVSVALTLSSSGKQTQTASGAVTVGATVSGSGKLGVSGTGSVAVLNRLTLAGAGATPFVGTGGALLALLLAGTGSTTSLSTRPLGKYKPEHDAALAALRAARGFSNEHRSALGGLSDAGQ